jgi:hypothetical protein
MTGASVARALMVAVSNERARRDSNPQSSDRSVRAARWGVASAARSRSMRCGCRLASDFWGWPPIKRDECVREQEL